MTFDGEEGGVLALEKDAFLLKAFRKIQKIGKELKSNGTSNMAGFLERNRFTRLGKDWKDPACMNVSLFTLYTPKRTITRWFSFSIFRRSIRFSSLWYIL